MKSSLLYKGNHLTPWCFVLFFNTTVLKEGEMPGCLAHHFPLAAVSHLGCHAVQPDLYAGISALHALLSFLHYAWILSFILFPIAYLFNIACLIPTPLLNLSVYLLSSQKLLFMPLCCSLMLLCNTLDVFLWLDCSFLCIVSSITPLYASWDWGLHSSLA